MNLRTGVDIIAIARIERAIAESGDRFLERVYTPAERAQAQLRMDYFAGRFAAKEAVSKALGTGIGDVAWHEIEVLGDDTRMPHLELSGAAARLAAESGISAWSVSISHTAEMAIAVVVGAGA